MTRSVAITVLCINVSSFLQQSLDDREITSDTGNMQRSAHCLRPAVYVATKSMKNLDELNVPLVRSHVKRGPSIAVTLVEQGLGQLWILVNQYLVAGAVITFFRSDPNISKQLFLVSSLLLLKQLSLANALLCS